MMMLTIASRELRSLFLSPLAWTILAIVQIILCFAFFTQLEFYLQIQPRLMAIDGAPGVTFVVVSSLLDFAAIMLLLVVPLTTMRLLAEERRTQTLSLLMSAPVSMTEIVLGKYLGILGFLIIMLAMIALMPLSLLFVGSLDAGLFASGLLGLLMLLGGFAAVGLFMSSLTNQPIIAAFSSFGVLFLLWILDWAGSTSAGQGDQTGNVLGYLSLLQHYKPMLQGVFNSSDVVYYLLFIITFIVLTIRRLDSYRLQH
jgi:ABC-2 type transport system permease protein